MAFIFEQDRGLNQFNFETAHLGPGKYIGPKFQKIQKGYAPFNSTVQKGKTKSQHQPLNVPGPGSYDIAKQLSQDQMQILANDSAIILKVQPTCSSQFKSTSQRFNYQLSQNPGPGSYNNQKDIAQQNKLTNNNSCPGSPGQINMLEGMRNINNTRRIASIPNKVIKVTHEPQSEILDLKKMIEMSSKLDNSEHVGPGLYEIKNTFEINRNKGANWSKSTVKRFQRKDENKNIGPGKYNFRDTQPKYKKNISSGFASDTVRTFYDNILYQTNIHTKALMRQQLGYKDVIPGPGSYQPEKVKQSINLQQKPLIYQYFGSTIERFKENEKGYNLDPGQYQKKDNEYLLNKTDNEIKEVSNQNKTSFLSCQERDSSLINKSAISNPGPTQYDTNNIQTIKTNLIKKFQMGYKGKFGSTVDRFDKSNPKQFIIPGPGQYKIEEHEAGKSKKKNDTSYFKSSTGRQPFEQKDYEIPSLGEYNLKYNDISYKLEKQKNFIENLKKIDVKKPGFDSSQPRFEYGKDINNSDNANNNMMQDFNNMLPYAKQNSQNISSYDDASTKAKTSQRTSELQSRQFRRQPAFSFAGKRLDYITLNQTSPSPTRYRCTEKKWDKKSFNIKYQH